MGFPGGSDGKESACNAGDLGLIAGSGRSPGEGNDNNSSILAWKAPWAEQPVGYSPWFHKESDTTEQLTLTHSTTRRRLTDYIMSGLVLLT